MPVYECINFLQYYKPVSAIEWDDNIAKACIDHANDIGQRGIKKKFFIKYICKIGTTDHIGSDGSNFTNRLERYGDWIGKIAEALCFGRENPVDIIL